MESRTASALCQVSSVEAIAQTAHVQQVTRLGRIRLELLPQAADVVVNDPVRDERVRAPGVVDQLLARQDPAPGPHEYLQQLELEGRQRHRRIAASDLAAIEIDVGVADSEDLRRRVAAAAPQQRGNPGAQL